MPSILSTNDKFGRVTIKNNLGRLDGTREQTVSVKVALYAPSAKNVTSTWLDSIVVDNDAGATFSIQKALETLFPDETQDKTPMPGISIGVEVQNTGGVSGGSKSYFPATLICDPYNHPNDVIYFTVTGFSNTPHLNFIPSA